ncbi:hypothetical protein NMY22_g4687 [Coprinellus aureogranulatus]|nr:hypothetical protein NMY22_g4687 [Coprinellus aureogranulatus]
MSTPNEFYKWPMLSPELKREIASRMDVVQIAALARTSKELASEGEAVLTDRTIATLGNFKLDAHFFDTTMFECEAGIGGPATLSILLANFPAGDDLHLFVDAEHADSLAERAAEVSKYRRITSQGEEVDIAIAGFSQHTLEGIQEIRTFSEVSDDSSEGRRKIHILTSRTKGPIAPIFDLDTTLDMNIITPLGVGCAYPDLTVNRVGLARSMELAYRNSGLSVPVGGDAWKLPTIQRYKQMGATLVEDWSAPEVAKIVDGHECGMAKCCPIGWRGLRTNRGLLWVMFGKYRGLEMETFLPDLDWRFDSICKGHNPKTGNWGRCWNREQARDNIVPSSERWEKLGQILPFLAQNRVPHTTVLQGELESNEQDLKKFDVWGRRSASVCLDSAMISLITTTTWHSLPPEPRRWFVKLTPPTPRPFRHRHPSSDCCS